MFNIENSNYDQLTLWHRETNNIFCGKLNPNPVLKEFNPASGWPGPLNTTPDQDHWTPPWPGPLNTIPGPSNTSPAPGKCKDQMYGLLFDFDIFSDKTTMWAKDNFIPPPKHFPIKKWFLFLKCCISLESFPPKSWPWYLPVSSDKKFSIVNCVL